MARRECQCWKPLNHSPRIHMVLPNMHSNWISELLMKCLASIYVIFRPPHCLWSFRISVIGIAMLSAFSRIRSFRDSRRQSSDGEQRRNFTYISEVAPVIARSPFVSQARNQVFNVGADRPYTVNELAEEVASAMGVEPKVIHLPARKEVTLAYSDHSKCSEAFGPSCAVELPEGLRKMATWVKEVGARKSSTFENIEIHRCLPASWRSS